MPRFSMTQVKMPVYSTSFYQDVILSPNPVGFLICQYEVENLRLRERHDESPSETGEQIHPDPPQRLNAAKIVAIDFLATSHADPLH
jgi:hypothetical protein